MTEIGANRERMENNQRREGGWTNNSGWRQANTLDIKEVAESLLRRMSLTSRLRGPAKSKNPLEHSVKGQNKHFLNG